MCYKELRLLGTFSYGYFGLLYPESTVYTLCMYSTYMTVQVHSYAHILCMLCVSYTIWYVCTYTVCTQLMDTQYNKFTNDPLFCDLFMSFLCFQNYFCFIERGHEDNTWEWLILYWCVYPHWCLSMAHYLAFSASFVWRLYFIPYFSYLTTIRHTSSMYLSTYVYVLCGISMVFVAK